MALEHQIAIRMGAVATKSATELMYVVLLTSPRQQQVLMKP